MKESEDNAFQLTWAPEILKDILASFQDTEGEAEIFYEQITPLQILQKMVEPDQEVSQEIGDTNHIRERV